MIPVGQHSPEKRWGVMASVSKMYFQFIRRPHIRSLMNPVFEHAAFGLNPTAVENLPTQQFGQYVQINGSSLLSVGQ